MADLQRRTVMGLALGAAGTALVAGCSDGGAPAAQGSSTTTRVATVGNRQEGVDAPVPRPRYAAVRVLDLGVGKQTQRVLADLGVVLDAIARVDGLTVTVGVGPTVVRGLRGAGFPGGTDLPGFASDRLEGGAAGGDLLVQVCGERRESVGGTAATLLMSSPDLSLRWGVDGFRGDVAGTGARDLLGFYDGVAAPTTSDQFTHSVWTGADDGLTDATIAVVRRIRVDHRRFGLLGVPAQEAVIGRSKATGLPLPTVAADAHARRAAPVVSGADGLMLRRNYSYRIAPDDQGLLFVSFQRTLATFTRTQASLEKGDALTAYAEATGAGTFLVLPRWSVDRPLGADLFA